ncbi:hypothetical protein CHLNCDRAFT_55227 [Chlorella variabilis]|uniref:Pyrroloquinoline quinone-dependent pyranose dehydrogenase beta-propeller domain-containing protein n=1 Tax=Chlorella variabilis TaxID=554065 RepID=E1ZSA3_CHLVA|nr:hypothetical protein CHLNCDRAFT_55227 [Chlorella variabilis]EFN51270.1 hypothetical protein CHLNCDRAFT_55227 [Chlorella variabilis]|eukprot:XP_005843372.1 hypothetical protein CHLNCDRAFT_55227 [Chlorella variabilis]
MPAPLPPNSTLLRGLLPLLVLLALPTASWEHGTAGRALLQSAAPPPPPPRSTQGLPLDAIQLPPGFSIELYSDDRFPARFLDVAEAGNATVVFVSSTKSVVTALVDRGGSAPVQACTLLDGQDGPNGIAYDPSARSLYVAEVRAITRHDNALASALAGCDRSLLRSSAVANASLLPPQASHSSRALAIGPADGLLYYTVAAPFNVDVCRDPYCTIHRIAKNGSGHGIFARGIRNAAGFDWVQGRLMFAGMERDRMGNDLPDDILGLADPATPGVDYGWPYCHWVGDGPPELREPGPGRIIPDPTVFPPGVGPSVDVLTQRCKEVAVPPVQALGPHVAPLGVLYWTPPVTAAEADGASSGQRQQWPAQYDGGVFVGEHGSWDRDVPIGYRIAHVQLSEDGRTAVGHSIFAEGWLGSDGKKWGRPVGLARLPDGSMLVADDKANTVYRISYDGTAGGAGAASSPSPPPPTPVATRWSLDVKFGGKMEAVMLLQEWVSTVGAAAGLTPANTSLGTGSIGAPESTLELEVSFSSLGELEEFWSSIPQAQHKAWGQRMQQFIVHGSPQWQHHPWQRRLPAAYAPAAAACPAAEAAEAAAAAEQAAWWYRAWRRLESMLQRPTFQLRCPPRSSRRPAGCQW